MARAPVSKTGGWGFESLHSCHFQSSISVIGHGAGFRSLAIDDSRPPDLTLALGGSTYPRIVCGPMSDFRGEHFPKGSAVLAFS
jgi:hypothetical protein